MQSLTLTQLCDLFQQPNIATANLATDSAIRQLSTDSRTTQPGDVFIAVVGETFDGHDYIPQAIANGAIAVVCRRPVQVAVPTFVVPDPRQAYADIANFWRRQFKLPIAAITGSCGKTTTKAMLVNILKQSHNVLYSQQNYNNEIGLPKTLLALTDAHQCAVLEMGACKVGDIAYLMQTALPQHSVITCAAPAHLETFGSIDKVAQGKGEIYAHLPADGTAALNVDDIYAPYWLSMLSDQKILTFAMQATADITCAYLSQVPTGIQFELVTDIGSTRITLPTLGLHNVNNALAAVAVARNMGVLLPDIQAGLETFTPVSQRMNRYKGINGATILDDSYNANPVAMQGALAVLAQEKGEKIFVMGDMLELGERSEQYHTELAHQAKAAGVTQLYAVGQQAQATVASFGSGATWFEDREALLAALKARLSADSVVLLKASNSIKLHQVASALVATEEI